MAYTVRTTKRFDKSVELMKRRGCNMEKLRKVLELLIADGTLPPNYRPHKLRGNHEGEWECHIEPDWLLIWQQNDTELTLLMINTGSHSDLF